MLTSEESGHLSEWNRSEVGVVRAGSLARLEKAPGFGMTPLYVEEWFPLAYNVRLNSGTAMLSVTTAKIDRYSMSGQMATSPASFSSKALNPCTA